MQETLPAEGVLAVVALVYLAIGCVAFLIPVIAFWKIFSRVGHPGPLALLMLVPMVNIGMLLWIAFSEWPIDRRAPRPDEDWTD